MQTFRFRAQTNSFEKLARQEFTEIFLRIQNNKTKKTRGNCNSHISRARGRTHKNRQNRKKQPKNKRRKKRKEEGEGKAEERGNR